MTSKEKIVKIIRNMDSQSDTLDAITLGDIRRITDALVAEGIGDVKERKFEADHYWRMWQGSLVELERAEHRAKVAERALCNACKDIKDICEYLVKFGGTGVITIESYAPEQSGPSAYIDRAEKELSEERKDD